MPAMYTAAAALASVCQSVCQRRLLLARGVRADSMRTCMVLQIYEWSRVRAAARARARCSANYPVNEKYYKCCKILMYVFLYV